MLREYFNNKSSESGTGTWVVLFLMVLGLNMSLFAQKISISDPYLQISAAASDPVYTTYTAAMERSRLYGDKGYKMVYDLDCCPLSYGSEKGGRMFTLWKIDQVVVDKTGEYFRKPLITATFPDMAVSEHQPFRGIDVQETFFVYSSGIALVQLHIANIDEIPHQVEIYPVFVSDTDSLRLTGFDNSTQAYISLDHESKYRLISSLRENYPYPTDTRNIFSAGFNTYSYGAYRGRHENLFTIKTDYYAPTRTDSLNMLESGQVSYMVLHGQFHLEPGEEVTVRFFRGWQDAAEDLAVLLEEINRLKHADLTAFVRSNIDLFSKVPRIEFNHEDEKLVYLSALNLARGCMLPASGETSYNFYVFSREPLWGWGHGHQVLHESLSMLAYAYLDPASAENSQRVYMEQQREDGLIAYRHGPRGMQDYPHYSKYLDKEMSTTSAPFFSWINLEIFRAGGDYQFLADAYESGVRYMNWLIENRDLDKDGMFEWGPYGLIENVRDWYNAVFQVSADRYLSVDKEDISDDLECLDLTVMMINEMRSLYDMGWLLGRGKEADKWKELADSTTELVNEHMWCDEKKFYFSVNRDDHSFTYLTRDLRREEIIGFLPLWAKAVPPERVPYLIEKLTDENKFWRRYGIPTLAADDEWYSPYVDYCCKWNGPVWLLWNYMVIQGLRNYGYHDHAVQVAQKNLDAVMLQLRKNHNFWESYSPDNEVLNCPPNYIWDAIIARVLMQMYGATY